MSMSRMERKLTPELTDEREAFNLRRRYGQDAEQWCELSLVGERRRGERQRLQRIRELLDTTIVPPA
jgi:hypothetical protein